MAVPFRKQARRGVPKGPWKSGPIPVIGLVGGIGSGKSSASAFFEARGAFVIEADKVGHALLNQSPARDLVLERFGPSILSADAPEGESPLIDRGALGSIVFADPSALRDLEAILHPRMRVTFEKAIARTIRKGIAEAVVLDAAILFEADWDSLCDRIVFIDAPFEQRLKRVAETRGWTEEILKARESSQKSREFKRNRSEFTISNHASVEHLRRGVDTAWKLVKGSVPSRASRGLKKDGAAPSSGDSEESSPG